MVHKSLDEMQSKAAEGLREIFLLELARLDEWQLRAVQEMKNGKTLSAIDRLLRIMERRAKLLGLDAPTVNHTHHSGRSTWPPIQLEVTSAGKELRVEEMTDEELAAAMRGRD